MAGLLFVWVVLGERALNGLLRTLEMGWFQDCLIVH